METEKEKLERRISALAVAMEVMTEEGEDTTSAEVTLSTLKDRLTSLTRPAIKDDVLGRWRNEMAIYPYDSSCNFAKQGEEFNPLTIEELLPTLAQWVPGAVRWRYVSRDSIGFYGVMQIIENEREDGPFRIPAPPRDDWQEVGGEL